MFHLRPWIAAALLVSSCGSGSKHSGPPSSSTLNGDPLEFSGTYLSGFEASIFFQDGSCGDAEAGLWLTSNDPSFGRRWTELFPEAESEWVTSSWVEIRFRGRLSPPGHYGHLNQWEREVEVEELIDMKRIDRCGVNPSIMTAHVEILHTLTFAPDDVELNESSVEILDILATTLKEHPEARVTIVARGASAEDPVARERASSVLNYLIGAGVPRDRLLTRVEVASTGPDVRFETEKTRNTAVPGP